MFLLRASLVRLCNDTGSGEDTPARESRLSLLFLILLGLITRAWLFKKTDDVQMRFLFGEEGTVRFHYARTWGPHWSNDTIEVSTAPQLSRFFCPERAIQRRRQDVTQNKRSKKKERRNRKESFKVHQKHEAAADKRENASNGSIFCWTRVPAKC